MRLSSASSFFIICTLYFLLGECRPLDEATEVAESHSSAPSSRLTSRHQLEGLIPRGKQSNANSGSTKDGGGNAGTGGSGSGGQTNASQGSSTNSKNKECQEIDDDEVPDI
ncbi:uncharacterized protein BT62DRAFT_922664 [Guyanagaster necrorhizus]|uniref:Secreted protein n=1 Tax=Guyanagaster necrorhizus TaxID=856835 RepID=A0A9P7VKW3_9AGAR|nr:uncharacterized protein BT62DRAFT_922664 [Guyanagaster necrorhizus MCA 3950]KAG7442502.1 hypothetical protein BT62DRAFT_922664 [Guyanagaster necrorhizus MCA 3950]